jgi:guanylate kinase
VIISAPSGAGKSTLAKHLLAQFQQLEFSISATNRAPRGKEQEGREYYFLSNQHFKEKIKQDAFVEWEEVYQGTCYGTLKSELERIHSKGNQIIFDVDVKGGLCLKKIFGNNALSIFIQPPSIEILKERLVKRGTDNPESIQKRLDKAKEEMTYAHLFDKVIVNDDFDTAAKRIKQEVESFLGAKKGK